MRLPALIFSSKYSQRMRKLSCKIFNDFYIPELPKKELEYGPRQPHVALWVARWHNDMRNYERNQERPRDLNPDKNEKYYPPHPQIRSLTDVLRQYGLYRDEHRDFNEAMKEAHLSKGRVYRERRGPIKKTAKKK